MGNHSSRGSKPNRRQRTGSTPGSRNWYIGIGIVVVVGAGLWFIRPQVSVSHSNTALLDVSTSGLGAHVTATALTASGTSIPLSVSDGALWPQKHVAPGTELSVTVRDAGFLGWSASSRETVVTPAAPRLVSDSIKAPLDRPLVLKYTVAASQVVLLSSNKTDPANNSRRVAVGPTPTRPDQHGILKVAARSRSWETLGPAETVSWSSVPLVTAKLSQNTPANSVAATAPLTVTFSSPIQQADMSQWTMSPSVPGSWHEVSDEKYAFTPSGIGFSPGTNVSVTIPGTASGVKAVDGSYLGSTANLTYQVPQGLTQTMQEWLAELGYLPLTFTPEASAPAPSLTTWQAAYTAPQGTFAWKYANVPATLEKLWNPISWTVVTQGAVEAFEHQHGMTVNGVAGPKFWNALRLAVINHDVDTKPYAYVYASETLPETLWLYVGGKIIITTPTNTGIPQDPTTIGTFPVDLRRPFQIMKGKNPDGSPYAVPVHWINYFHGGEAVHGYLRASYGFPQSLGCVEVPIPTAKEIFPHLYIGALVTVAAPGSPAMQLLPVGN